MFKRTSSKTRRACQAVLKKWPTVPLLDEFPQGETTHHIFAAHRLLEMIASYDADDMGRAWGDPDR